jgi:hypothetical protein
MAEPWDASLVNSNSIHGPSAQNRWCSTRKFLKICLVSTISSDSDFSWPWDQWHWKDYLLMFPCICTSLESELDSKSDYWTLNWLGPPPCCACFLGSPTPSCCPICPPWSTPWFLITIKSLGCYIFSRWLACEHKNEFTQRRSCCAHDLVIGPYTSIEGVIVSDVLMSSSSSLEHPWFSL